MIYSWRVIAAWLECFPEKPSWCQSEQNVLSALSGPTDWILRYIKTTFTCGETCQMSAWKGRSSDCYSPLFGDDATNKHCEHSPRLIAVYKVWNRTRQIKHDGKNTTITQVL